MILWKQERRLSVFRNLGYHATHAIVYAQLLINGFSHGLHLFVVPIRQRLNDCFLNQWIDFSDPTTYQTYPGVEAGDIGAKCGWNGLDNG